MSARYFFATDALVLVFDSSKTNSWGGDTFKKWKWYNQAKTFGGVGLESWAGVGAYWKIDGK